MTAKSGEKEKADKIYFRINREIEQGNFSTARAQMEKLEKVEGETGRIKDLKGIFAFRENKLIESLEYHKKAVEMKPDSKRFLLNLGNIYMAKKDWQNAAIQFKEILRKNRNYFPALNNLSMALFRLGQLDEALGCVEKMKQVKMNSPEAYRLESLIYFEKGDLERAFAAADKNISLDPQNPLTYFTLGQILQEMERYEEAVKAYEMARDLNPSDMDILRNLALSYGNIDRFDLALPLLEKVVVHEPQNGIVHKGLALIYKLYGKDDLAEEHAKLARKYGQEV